MKKYVRIKFTKLDFFDFRFGGPGLGNLLFVWYRPIVYADKLNLPVLSPNWKTFTIGPYLRHEKDKKNYKNLFTSDGIKGFKKYLIQLYSIKQIQNSKIRFFCFVRVTSWMIITEKFLEGNLFIKDYFSKRTTRAK